MSTVVKAMNPSALRCFCRAAPNSVSVCLKSKQQRYRFMSSKESDKPTNDVVNKENKLDEQKERQPDELKENQPVVVEPKKKYKLFPMSEFDEGAAQRIPNPSDPFGRAYRIIKRDLINISQGQFVIPEEEIFPTFVDVAIIGGGIIGSSIAYWLKHRASKGLNVVVIEKDPSFTRSATALSVGGLQLQFSLKENIQMAMFGAEFMRNIKKHLTVLDRNPPDINFTPYNHLFLANEREAESLQQNYLLQIESGARVELLTARKIKERFPWINVDDIELGCCGYGSEGWFDPIRLLKAFQQKAASLGARYLNAEVTGFTFAKVDGVKIIDEGERNFERVDQIVVRTEEGERRIVNPAIIILAAGCDSLNVGKYARIGTYPGILKYEIPVEPRKRYAYAFECPEGPGIDCPHVIDYNGAYFRREGYGGNYICGKTPRSNEEPDPANLDVDYSYFDNQLLPLLRKRVPSFGSLKITSAWAGVTDYNTFDGAGFIGTHPLYSNLMLATGFDCLGAQQAPAIGRAIMELIIDGDFESIDLNRLSFDRIINQAPLHEMNII